jgi:hypothetical protein
LTSLVNTQPQKQPKYQPLVISKAFTGMFTQRNFLNSPAGVVESKYYSDRADALCMGTNVELTNCLTLQRRPGLVAFSSATYPTAPLTSFSFSLSNGTIQVLFDCGPTPSLSLTSVVSESGGYTTYTGTITGGASNAYLGLYFQVTGFSNLPNNGTFLCIGSSATTLVLDNPAAIAEVQAAVALSAGAVYWDQQNGLKTLLFAKQPGAAQTHFVGVDGVLYAGDGVDTWKYTPLNPNKPSGANASVWNWGIQPPAQPPTGVITASGAGATTWQANTVYSTMGITRDAQGNLWQLIGVDADGSQTGANPPAVYGTSGSGQPDFDTALYSTTAETSGTPITWQCRGPVQPWAGGTKYGDLGENGTPGNCCVYDPTTNAIFGNFHGSGALGLSGNLKPNFSLTYGAGVQDGTCKWFLLATFSTSEPWLPGQAYDVWVGTGSALKTPTAQLVFSPNTFPPTVVSPIYLFVSETNGTSGTSYAPFPNPAVTGQSLQFGQQVTDNQLLWMCVNASGGAWQALTGFYPWTVAGTPFGCIVDSNGNIQVCIASAGTGLTGSSAPTWATAYGGTTVDGGLTWSCCGPPVGWASSAIWHLPIQGFQPSSQAQRYGGSVIDSSSALVEGAVSSGKSGSSAPSWSALGLDTIDGAGYLVWYAESVVSSNSLAWTAGLCFAYSFKARAFDDYYSPAPLGGGNNPPQYSNTAPSATGLTQTALGVPTGSATNAVSTASPVYQITGGNAGAIITLSGLGSIDPQVDTLIIWCSPDVADGSGEMLEATEIPAPQPLLLPDGTYVAQPWTFQFYLPLTATQVYPGLNVDIPAPIDDQNNPPDPTFLPMVYNFERIWGGDGPYVPFSSGPDTLVGNPNECFLPTNAVPFLAPVVRVVRCTQGLVTLLTDSVEIIAGGPTTASFYSVTIGPGIGLLGYNALDVLAGEMYFFSADNQFRIMTPSLQINNAGFAIGDQFANQPRSGVSDTIWDPSKVYVASHQNGTDNAIFVADGSTGWYRLNSNQIGGATITSFAPVWSPYATIANGCQMVQSVETSPGIKTLLVGGTGQNQMVSERSLTTFTDNDVPYEANCVMGVITLASSGQLAVVKFVEAEFTGYQNSTCSVAYLINEIPGSLAPDFTVFTTAPLSDPPSLYGNTMSPQTYSPLRWYFNSTGSLARCRYLSLKIDFGISPNGDELLSTTVFGRVLVEA